MDQEEKKRRKEEWKYIDPHPNEPGILLSDKIHEFCNDANLLISEDYCEKNLRPASYTLRIGDAYIDSDGVHRTLTDSEESFVFKKNSIVFVSTKEKLDIPFYIIARFNIRVTWVYDGVLLGTGPQVDPGYTGYLSCPLYNLTNIDIRIKRGEDFATIDFEKTTSLPKEARKEGLSELIGKAKDKINTTVDGRTFSFYKRPPLMQLASCKAHRIVSSLIEMETEVRTWRNIGIGAVIAFFGLTLSLLAFGVNIYRQNGDLLRQLSDSRNELREVNERIAKLEQVVGRLSGNRESPPAAREKAPPPKHMGSSAP